MALSRTEHTPHTSATEGSSTTTGTYTIANGRRIVVLGKFTNGGSGTDAPAALLSIDDTGADLVWTKSLSADNGDTDYSSAEITWTATSNGTPFTITVTKTGTAVASWGINVYDYAGAHATNWIGATASGQLGGADGAQSLTLSGAPAASSEVIGSTCATVNGGDVNATEGTDWTERYDVPHTDWAMRHIQVRTGFTSTTVPWADVAVGGSGNYKNPVAIAIEIIAAEESGSETITVDSASLALEPQNVSLLFDEAYVIPVVNASMVLESQEIPFILSQPGTHGELALQGQDINLLAQALIAVDNGSLALTGQDVTLTFVDARTLAVDSASYVLSGQVVALQWSEFVVSGVQLKARFGFGRRFGF